MAIITTYPTFRWYACDKIVSSPAAATFANANPDTIADAGVDFVVDGVEAGMVTRPNGTASNDGFLFNVDTVAANLITLDAADAVVAEGPVTCTLTSYWLDTDGYEEFPGPFGHTNLVRSGGFSGGFSGIVTPWLGAAMNISVNALVADAAPTVDEYHWYLSQRTDVPASQGLLITPYEDVLGQTYSGSVTITYNGLLIIPNITPAVVADIFKHCDLYCIRVADGSIQWMNLLRELIGA